MVAEVMLYKKGLTLAVIGFIFDYSGCDGGLVQCSELENNK